MCCAHVTFGLIANELVDSTRPTFLHRMPVTPRKLVHWDVDGPSISALDSPFFNNSYESVVSTSSLEHINSQLVAHGFVPSPGISLEGISNDDSTRVVKCLLGMLSQRVVSIVANLLY